MQPSEVEGCSQAHLKEAVLERRGLAILDAGPREASYALQTTCDGSYCLQGSRLNQQQMNSQRSSLHLQQSILDEQMSLNSHLCVARNDLAQDLLEWLYGYPVTPLIWQVTGGFGMTRRSHASRSGDYPLILIILYALVMKRVS